MEFVLVLLVALGIKALQPNFPVVVDKSIRSLNIWLSERVIETKSVALQLFITLFFPIAICMIVVSFVSDFIWPAEFIASIIVLSYAFGRDRLTVQFEYFLSNLQGQDIQQIYRDAFHIDNSHTDDALSMHSKVCEKMVYQALEETVAVLFWLLVFGPLGALFYRLAHIYREQQDIHSPQYQLVDQLIHALDWIPVRILTLIFALLGNFVAGFNTWLDYLTEWDRPAALVLKDSALHSIGVSSSNSEQPLLDYAEQELNDIYQLLIRTINSCVILIILIYLLV